MQKISSSGAIAAGKCPRCRKGNIFKHPAFKPTKFSKMYSQCPVCDLHFEREPGFFFGAMYISYAFSVAIFIAVGVILSLFGDFSLNTYLITTLIVVTLLLPVLFRYSRILFLYFFGGVLFDSKYTR
ncbi:MAG: DUF983 domain-containing protein [Fulvivirga sp.]